MEAGSPTTDATSGLSEPDANGASDANGTFVTDSAVAADSPLPATEAGADAQSAAVDDASVFKGTGTYELVNVLSGAALAVSGGSTTEGSLVVGANAENTTNEQWTFSYYGNGFYTVLGVGSGLGLGVPGSAPTDGTNIEIDTPIPSSSDQQWSLTEESPSQFRLTPGNATGSCAALPAGSASANKAAVLETYTGDPGQLWFVEPVTPGDAGIICSGTPGACSTLTSMTACAVSDCDWSGTLCTGAPLPCSWHTGTDSDCRTAGCQSSNTVTLPH